ncbi:hypothetical protein HYE55_03190 [Aggregatibacter actinomycetemcomitans]|nr:hypothetical protein [Aggregatibacter actinomycetemcomitans]
MEEEEVEGVSRFETQTHEVQDRITYYTNKLDAYNIFGHLSVTIPYAILNKDGETVLEGKLDQMKRIERLFLDKQEEVTVVIGYAEVM